MIPSDAVQPQTHPLRTCFLSIIRRSRCAPCCCLGTVSASRRDTACNSYVRIEGDGSRREVSVPVSRKWAPVYAHHVGVVLQHVLHSLHGRLRHGRLNGCAQISTEKAEKSERVSKMTIQKRKIAPPLRRIACFAGSPWMKLLMACINVNTSSSETPALLVLVVSAARRVDMLICYREQ